MNKQKIRELRKLNEEQEDAYLSSLEKGLGAHIKGHNVSRRGFIFSMLGLGGLASTLALPTGTPTLKELLTNPAAGLPEKVGSIRARTLDAKIDDIHPVRDWYERPLTGGAFAYFQGGPYPEDATFPYTYVPDKAALGAGRPQEMIEKNIPGSDLKSFAYDNAMMALAFSLSSGAVLSKCLGGSLLEDTYPGVAKWSGTPKEASTIVKRFSHFIGPDQLIGITEMDRRWVDIRTKFSDEVPNGEQLEGGPVVKIDDEGNKAKQGTPEYAAMKGTTVIPTTMKYVIVISSIHPYQVEKFSPAVLGHTAMHGYWTRHNAAAGIGLFIRNLGYSFTSDFALNLPFAIMAGIGQSGRSGLIVAPECGASNRPLALLTDLPLESDKIISFGVKGMCDVCMKCAKYCPSNSITFGDYTDGSERNDVNSPPTCMLKGVEKWYQNYLTCLGWWREQGVSCQLCQGTCPFTKAPGWGHDFARWSIMNIPALNPMWVALDDAMYGVPKQDAMEGVPEAEEWWWKGGPRSRRGLDRY